jgi:signal transduction histidine kinase
VLHSESGSSQSPFDGSRAGCEPEHDAGLAALSESHCIAACIVERADDDDDDGDFRIHSISPAFTTLTGLRQGTAPSLRLLRPELEPFWLDLCERVARSGGTADFDHSARPFRRVLRGSAFRISDAPIRVALIVDNTAPLPAGYEDDEDAPAPVSDEAALEQFGATLAHELRGPLAAVVNGLFVVKQTVGPTAGAGSALAMMERQLARLRQLVDDLMDVGRLSSRKVQLGLHDVNLHHLISDCIEASADSFEARQHQIEIDSDGAALVVRGDRVKLMQVFVNLLANSIQYTPPGGHIWVRMGREQQMAKIEVSDDGAGIPKDQLGRVFDLFRQCSGAVAHSVGLGIGLAIVRGVVQLHGGTVDAHSDGSGLGSTFTVRLPLNLS